MSLGPGVSDKLRSDDSVFEDFGYKQQLNRSIGHFTSFCISFSIISATSAVFTSFGYGITTGGPAFAWFMPIAMIVGAIWCLIIADMSTQMPIAGYAYQWSSRLVNRHFGWFTGWIAMVGWLAGWHDRRGLRLRCHEMRSASK